MPDETPYMEPETWTGPHLDDIRALHGELRGVYKTRNDEYAEARELYFGEMWSGADIARPKNRYSLSANYLKSFVDKDVQIMMGSLPGLQVMPPSADKPGRDLAERLEAVLYGCWDLNQAHQVFLNAAWNSVTLRRGLIYQWWDANVSAVRFKSVSPDNFYPVMDGNDVVECIYVSRRLTRTLKRSYPHLAAQIYSDDGRDMVTDGMWDGTRVASGVMDALSTYAPGRGDEPTMTGYTTVIDYYDRDGAWVRIMGDAVHRQNLSLPFGEVPFIEITNSVQGDEHEPQNAISQLVELNRYFNIILSQEADIIKKYSNPPVVDMGSGVDPAKLKSYLAQDGAIIPIRQNGKLELMGWQGNMPEAGSQMDRIQDIMYDLSGKPRSAYGQTVTNQSGVMTNLSLTPTLQSNEMRQTVWGFAIALLNKRILQMYEQFSKSRPIEFRGTRPRRNQPGLGVSPYAVSITGKEIAGWYRNEPKWPSAIRTDDPVYIQTELSKLAAQPVQAISLYDFLENIGIQDVEAYIDRIRAEREDPRLHPEILQQTIESLTSMGSLGLGGDAGGLGALPTDPSDAGMGDEAAAMASGFPQPPAVA